MGIRKVLCIALCAALLLPRPMLAWAASPASKTVSIGDKAVEPKYQDVALSGARPVAAGGPEALVLELNKRFDAQYNAFLKRHATDGAKHLSFEVRQLAGSYVSVLFYCQVALPTNDEQYVATTVLDDTGRVVTIADVLGADALRLINRDLSAKLGADPLAYNPAFHGIDERHDFYVTDTAVIVPFGEFELLASASGIVERSFKFDDFKTFTLERRDYAVKPEYGVKMVPLRPIADAFGFTLEWDGAASSVTVLRGKTTVAAMKIDENRYQAGPYGARRALEAAPELRDGRTYVPLSFCEDYLAAAARTNPNGTVTLTAYQP